MRPKCAATELDARRRLTIELHHNGLTRTQVALVLGMARQAVQKWKVCVCDGGKITLKDIP